MIYCYYYQTDIGMIRIVENDEAISQVTFADKQDTDILLKETPLIKQTIQQINEYLKGERKVFTIKINPSGTAFQKKVWDQLLKIPYGETKSYQWVATEIGNKQACRAVGMANNRNPIVLIIPCHRVIGANGKLIGYGGGLPIKQRLLNIEKQHIK